MSKLPTPVEYDGRICFGINYFASEADAMAYHAYVRERGCTYNGGFYHGRPCGRDKSWDKQVDGKTLYAVTE